jgi:ubiquinone/menaquinone biosynthesis C-methylase UbiE
MSVSLKKEVRLGKPMNYTEPSPKEVIHLPGGNIYVEGYGYTTNHVPPELDRSNPRHWDAQYIYNAEAFHTAWQPRHGPLEFVYNLASEYKGKPFEVLNLGGGIGDFSVNLSQLPGVHVTHVDFSEQANHIAQENIRAVGNPEQATVVTMDNEEYLNLLAKQEQKVDFIFLYGVTENIPEIATIRSLFTAVNYVLKEGGHLWYVGLQQPFLSDHSRTETTDILGEYPVKPDIVREIVEALPDMQLIREEIESRPDKHPLVPEAPPVEHLHTIHRAVFRKGEGITPEFGFKDPISPQ